MIATGRPTGRGRILWRRCPNQRDNRVGDTGRRAFASDPPVAFDARPDAGFRFRRGGTALYVFALPADAAPPEEQ